MCPTSPPVMLNVFQHPPGHKLRGAEEGWILKQVQDDEARRDAHRPTPEMPASAGMTIRG